MRVGWLYICVVFHIICQFSIESGVVVYLRGISHYMPVFYREWGGCIFAWYFTLYANFLSRVGWLYIYMVFHNSHCWKATGSSLLLNVFVEV
jgi:hypothetical protein